uniref:Uncharacterized protein n=1 Tax=Arundo donax TaxID=35708 RepID=A0A0A9A8Q9_ARUDO
MTNISGELILKASMNLQLKAC